MRIGLISDTHGQLRPEVARAFDDVDLILHAGDVGSLGVLAELEAIARVEAVYGNVDGFELGLPPEIVIDAEGSSIHVSHGHELGSPTPEKLAARYRADVIVFGHTHRPLVRRVGDALVVNPGSAGPRRFNLAPSVALLTLERNDVRVDIVRLDALQSATDPK